MNEAVLVLSVIVVLFAVLLTVKSITRWKFCVICVSVSITWIALLALYWLGLFKHPVIIAVLMGQTIVGLYYFLEKRTAQEFHIFRLPLLLTMTLAAFIALGVSTDLATGMGLMALLWTALSLLYLYRRNPKTKLVVDRIIACCKDW